MRGDLTGSPKAEGYGAGKMSPDRGESPRGFTGAGKQSPSVRRNIRKRDLF